MKKFIAIFAVFITITAFKPIFSTEGDPYIGCCGTKPVEIVIDKSLVYIPNVFTPNADGLNDVFKPFYDEKIMKVTGFKILSADEKLIWENKLFNPEKPLTGWLGLMSKDSTYTGLFKYSISFTTNAGTIKVIDGEACSIYCNPKIPVNISDKANCFFPMQFQKDSVNHFSPIYLEVDCLKN
jgi:CHU_C Type IX secretion signal domain